MLMFKFPSYLEVIDVYVLDWEKIIYGVCKIKLAQEKLIFDLR